MNTKRRIGVFETNSSSTHVLFISARNADKLMDTLFVDDWGYVTIDGGEFGWEFRRYNDANTKANYVAVLLNSLKNWLILFKEQPNLNEYITVLGEWADRHYGTCYNNFVSVIREQTEAKGVRIELADNSYIDHQSAETVNDFDFLLDKEKIRQFIFNKNSWLLTGNDNSEQTWVVKEGKLPTLS